MTRYFSRRTLLGGSAGAAVMAALGVGLWRTLSQSGDAPPPLRGQFGEFTPAAPKPVPAFQLVGGDDQPRAMSDFAGRVVLLNYWATWCAPCVEEMPALDRLQARLGGPDFAVVAVAVDRQGKSLVEPFLAKLGIRHLTPYLDKSGESMRALGVRGLPTTVLIDRRGRERGRLEGAAAWDSPEAEALIRFYLDPARG